MKFSDLFTDKSDGRMSIQRTWMNVAMLILTVVFGWYAYHWKLEEWMYIAYSLVAVFPNLVSKWINVRWGIGEEKGNKNE